MSESHSDAPTTPFFEWEMEAVKEYTVKTFSGKYKLKNMPSKVFARVCNLTLAKDDGMICIKDKAEEKARIICTLGAGVMEAISRMAAVPDVVRDINNPVWWTELTEAVNINKKLHMINEARDQFMAVKDFIETCPCMAPLESTMEDIRTRVVFEYVLYKARMCASVRDVCLQCARKISTREKHNRVPFTRHNGILITLPFHEKCINK